MEFIQFLQGELLLTGTLFALIILLIVNIYSEKYRKYQVVDTNGAVSLMDDELIIIDVREEKERKAGFLSNDLNIPMGQVKAKMDSLDKSKNILVYCKSGTRSDRIADILSKNDFQKVSSLKGGFNAWLKADLPIQR